MAKKKHNPSQVSQADLLAFFNSTKDEPTAPSPVRAQKISAADEKKQKELSEIGCTKVRLWSKTVEVLGWAKRNELVNVQTENGTAAYEWPFNVVFPFINLEIIEDCGYLERFGNGDEYVIDGKRYGVRDDVVWAGGKRYLSSSEKANFGSFRDFLAKHPDHTVKRTII